MSLCGFGDFVGFGGLMLEEAEGGVALAEDASLQEAADALGEIESAAVLGDDEAALAEKWGGAEEAEDAVVLRFFGVGRVDEHEIEWGVSRFVLVGDFLEGAEGDEVWSLLLLMSRSEEVAEQSIRAQDVALLAKHAFAVAQAFHSYYQKPAYSLLYAKDEDLRAFRCQPDAVDMLAQARENGSLSAAGGHGAGLPDGLG